MPFLSPLIRCHGTHSAIHSTKYKLFEKTIKIPFSVCFSVKLNTQYLSSNSGHEFTVEFNFVGASVLNNDTLTDDIRHTTEAFNCVSHNIHIWRYLAPCPLWSNSKKGRSVPSFILLKCLKQTRLFFTNIMSHWSWPMRRDGCKARVPVSTQYRCREATNPSGGSVVSYTGRMPEVDSSILSMVRWSAEFER